MPAKPDPVLSKTKETVGSSPSCEGKELGKGKQCKCPPRQSRLVYTDVSSCNLLFCSPTSYQSQSATAKASCYSHPFDWVPLFACFALFRGASAKVATACRAISAALQRRPCSTLVSSKPHRCLMLTTNLRFSSFMESSPSLQLVHTTSYRQAVNQVNKLLGLPRNHRLPGRCSLALAEAQHSVGAQRCEGCHSSNGSG